MLDSALEGGGAWAHSEHLHVSILIMLDSALEVVHCGIAVLVIWFVSILIMLDSALEATSSFLGCLPFGGFNPNYAG